MTAPQHEDTTASSEQGNSHVTQGPVIQGPANNQGQKLQRCWFVALGLMGGFGFVSSHVNLAIAETDVLISDNLVSESNLASAHDQAAADSYAADSSVTHAYTLTEVNYLPAQPSLPVAEAAVTPTASTQATTPTVTDTAVPTFTYQSKHTPTKTAGNSSSPLAGLIEAGTVAGPVSAYTHSRVNSQANAEATNATLVSSAADAAGDAPVVEAAPVVPDILPAAPAAPAAPPAAPPIVNIEPAVEAAPEAAPPIQATEVVPATLPESANLPEEYNSVFVDPTDYSVGATQSPEVVISEQSTGCEFTVGQNQAVPNGACGLAPAPAPVANTGESDEPGSAIAADRQQPVATTNAPAAASAPAVNVGPVSFSASGIQLSTSAAGREYLNRSVRPLVSLQAAERFIFPLAIPSPITSLFGFRVHPISGDRRFHAGTDIGAEQGTPVLAAQNGTVAAAEYSGGYGLMVVLRHELEDTNLESRYAHLAETFVEPGTEVSKGDIIGLVGSTGNSTGPHLHFEMRQLTADGWVLINPDGMVQASLANLVNALNNPMSTLSFNFSDFNLSNLRAGSSSIKTPAVSTEIPTFPGQDGIPFRPAQPNAS